MPLTPSARAWLEKLHHDLVKRALWTARDCRALQRHPESGELIAEYIDDDGTPIEPYALWCRFRSDAPVELQLEQFDAAIRSCMIAAAQNDLPGVLSLEAAFEQLRAQLQ